MIPLTSCLHGSAAHTVSYLKEQNCLPFLQAICPQPAPPSYDKLPAPLFSLLCLPSAMITSFPRGIHEFSTNRDQLRGLSTVTELWWCKTHTVLYTISFFLKGSSLKGKTNDCILNMSTRGWREMGACVASECNLDSNGLGCTLLNNRWASHWLGLGFLGTTATNDPAATR